jgi:integrase
VRSLPNLLLSRHGVYYLRLYHNGRETKLSLRTKDYPVAKLAALRFHLERSMSGVNKFEVDFFRGIVRTDGTAQDAAALENFLNRPGMLARLAQPTSPAAPVAAPLPVDKPAADTPPALKPFLEATAEYLVAKRLENGSKTLAEKKSTYQEFASLHPNLDTNHVTKASAVAYKNWLISQGAKNSRLNKKLSFLKDFVEYATGHGYSHGANPFAGLSVAKKGPDSISFDQFTDEELVKIFGATYLEYMSEPNYKWVPLLALFSGARLNELAGLRLEEVYQTSGVWVMKIPRERAKNDASVREIPVHDQLIKMGFLDYVAGVRVAAPLNGLVFPELVSDTRWRSHVKAREQGVGQTEIDYAKNCGRRFGKLLDLPGVSVVSPEKVFHSFRSTVINRLSVAGVNSALTLALVGHTSLDGVDTSSPHFQIYQKPKPIQVLQQALNLLRYDFLESSAVFGGGLSNQPPGT